MAQKAIRNLNEYAAKLVLYGKATRGQQRLAVARSTARMDQALDQAAVRLGGGDSTISGVGKSGGKLDHLTTRPIDGPDQWVTVFRKKGPWQIRDNTRTGGDTAVRMVSPNLRRSPRPIDPAKKYMPSLLTRNGQFMSNFSVTGPYIVVNAGRGRRLPAWRNAVQSTQPRIVDLHTEAFDRAAKETFG